MAPTTKTGKIVWIITASLRPRDNMMDFQKHSMPATLSLALMPITCQNQSARGWGNGGDVALIGLARLAIAMGLLKFCFSDFQIAFIGVYGSITAIRTLVDMDLYWWFTGSRKFPPGVV